VISRNSRTPSEYISYGLYFYFSGLSLRKTADSRLSADCVIKRNHVSNWNWIQKHNPQKISSDKKKVSEYVIDETVIKVGPDYVWIWVATIESENKEILGMSISKERNMFVVTERFLSDVVEKYG
jgi:putative transposase